MKKIMFAMLAAVLMLTSCGYERVDAGYEGIKVNLYGDSKGVDGVSLVTGVVWYNPITTAVYEYPTFVQTVDYPAFEVNSKDGTKFTVDPSALIKIADTKSPVIFKKYRTDVDKIIKNTLYVYIKDAARIEFNKYNADEIVSNREAVDKAFETRVRECFLAEHFILDQLSPGIQYPKSYEDAINQKNKAIQDQMRVQNEVAVAKADAEKKVAIAKGEAERQIVNAKADAEAIRIKADAEAYYNRTVASSLSITLVNMKAVERWDGKTPIVAGGNGTFIDASKFVK